MEKKHRVLIAEDQHLLRRGLCRLLSELQDYSIVGEAGDGLEAYRLATTIDPDLILMDLSMPGMSGFDVIAAIKRDAPRIRIVVLTVHRGEDYVRGSLAAGADGYVNKDAPFEVLVDEMRIAMRGEAGPALSVFGAAGPAPAGAAPAWAAPATPASPELAARTPCPSQRLNALTQRERAVMRLVVEGNTNRQVGEQLSLSTKTIEKHRANLMRKLGLTNLTGLVRAAIDMGVLTLPLPNEAGTRNRS